MSNWARTGLSALITGTVASIVTTGALACLAKAERKGALQPTNSTSHWWHGEVAASVQEADIAHTVLGYGTHHGSAVFWALPFEVWLAGQPPRTPLLMLRDATMMSAIAAAVDYGIAPKRLTPGWENVLSKRSIAATYGAMALGLAAGALITQEWRHRRSGRPLLRTSGMLNKGFGVQVTIAARQAGERHVQPLVVVARDERDAELVAAALTGDPDADAETLRELTAAEINAYGLNLRRHGDARALPALNL